MAVYFPQACIIINLSRTFRLGWKQSFLLERLQFAQEQAIEKLEIRYRNEIVVRTVILCILSS
jgi:hypothetical protein